MAEPEARRRSTPLTVAVYQSMVGPATATAAVTDRDLAVPMTEVWLDGHLRRGLPQTPLAAVRARLRPVPRTTREEGRVSRGTGRPCAGFTLETRNAAGVATECHFPRDVLEPVAARLARRLVHEGRLRAGQAYLYDLLAPGEDATADVVPTQCVAPPRVLRRRLAPLLGGAEAVGVDPGLDGPPVLVTRRAFAEAERVSRKGERADPPVESGGLLAGTLCSCPESGELFAVVTDVLEAAGAESTTYSLTYSGATWERIQNVLRARQSQPATRTQRLLGQAHGHNFLPLSGAPPCAACAHVAMCTRTTAFLSAEDRQWSRALFASDPWHLSQVFGFDARRQKVSAFFGQRGGELVRRGFHLIEDFAAPGSREAGETAPATAAT